MNKYTVKDLMVPISEYATVPIGTTLFGAILALEEAQENFDHGKYQHRAILVLDDKNKVVGRLSQLRVLNAMDAADNYSRYEQLKIFKFSDTHIEKVSEKDRLARKIFTEEALKKVAKKLVNEFMQKPNPDEYVAETSAIDMAIHKMAAGAHQSLLATRGDEIVGVLRLSDVFAATFHTLKELEVV